MSRDYRLQRISKWLMLKLIFVILLISTSTFLHSYNFLSPIIRAQKINVTSEQLEFKLRDKSLIINSERFTTTVSLIQEKNIK